MTTPYTIQPALPGEPLGDEHVDAHDQTVDAIDDIDTRLNQWSINVKDYGAVGDGSTDDSAAIQDAIDALPDEGGQLFFPLGQYNVYTTLDFAEKGPCTIMGVGKAYTTAQTSTPGTLEEYGSKIVGMTADMDIMSFPSAALSGSHRKHAGPLIKGLTFEDGLAGWSQKTVTSLSWAAGTLSCTTSGAHGFTVGMDIYLDKATNANPGSSWDGLYTIATTPTSNTFTAALADDPGSWASGGKVQREDTTALCTMTGIHISGHTRFHVERCDFTRLNMGVYADGTSRDVSWSQVEDCSFRVCNYGVRGEQSGAGACSIEVKGGDAQIGSNQVGYSFYDTTGCRVTGMKIDVGMGQSGSGSIGIEMEACTKFYIGGVMWEADVDTAAAEPCHTTKLHASAAGQCWGDVSGVQVQGSITGTVDYSNAIGVGIYGIDSTDYPHAINVIGGTYQSIQTAIYIDENARNVNIFGGVVLVGVEGIVIEDGAEEVNVIGFQHSNNQLLVDYTHITDPGGAIINAIGNHDHKASLLDGVTSSAWIAGPDLAGAAIPADAPDGSIFSTTGGIAARSEGVDTFIAGSSSPFSGVVSQDLAGPDVATSTGDTLVHSYTFPGGSLTAGSQIRIRALGLVDAGGAPSTVGVKVKFGAGGHGVTRTWTPVAGNTDRGWAATWDAVCYAVDGDNVGTWYDGIEVQANEASAAAGETNVAMGGVFTIDLDNDQTVEVYLTVTTSDGTTGLESQIISVELVRP